MSSWDLIRKEIGTFRAGEDMTAAKGKAVVFNAFQVWQIAGLTGPLTGIHHGILTNNPPSGGVASVQVEGVAMCRLGGSVVAGRFVDIDANGDLVEVHPSGQVGVALENGIAGSIIPVMLMRGVVGSSTIPRANDAVQARRTTDFTLSSAFVDVTLDATDVETDDAIIQHDNSLTDRINILQTGTYLIAYDATADPDNSAPNRINFINGRVRVNDTSIIPGSIARTNFFRLSAVSDNIFDNHLSCSFITNLNQNDFITFQLAKTIQSSDGLVVANEISLKIVRLK